MDSGDGGSAVSEECSFIMAGYQRNAHTSILAGTRALLYNAGMLHRRIALALLLAASLQGVLSQGSPGRGVDMVFPLRDTFRIIVDPIPVGIEAFEARLDRIRAEEGREPLGLVLAGGSARAFAHIGVIQELEAAGIRPDFIVANSMGAVIGMLYAAGISPAGMADIVSALPLENYLAPVLPTMGGIIHAGAFTAAVEMMVGRQDLSKAPIPIIVTAEDLRTRRQVELAAGEFARVMAATFAMPAIFEPVALGDFLLVDGGSTNLVPVEIAARYSSLLIVSTALYNKSMSFGNPLTVLNRTFDIGKTRAGMEDLLAARPFVIRNEVENISYMEFSSPEAIIERGRLSALASIGAIAGLLPPSSLRRPLSPELAEARAMYETKIPSRLADLRQGILPTLPPSLRFTLRAKVLDAFEPSPMTLSGQPYLGLAMVGSAGKAKATLSSIVGLSGLAGRQWGLAAGLSANPVGALRASAELRLWGDFGQAADLFLEAKSVETLAALSWSSRSDDPRFVPFVEASLLLPFGGAVPAWETRAGLLAEIGLSGRVHSDGVWTGFFSAKAGGFADTLSGSLRWGPEATLKAGLVNTGRAALRGRTALRFDASGLGSGSSPGLSLERDDAYRGLLPAGQAPLAAAANLELVWLARVLEFDAGEILLVKNVELGPYLDGAWLAADGSGTLPDAFTIGMALSGTMSFAGLTPFDLSLFAGMDLEGNPAIGLRSGRLFPVLR